MLLEWEICPGLKGSKVSEAVITANGGFFESKVGSLTSIISGESHYFSQSACLDCTFEQFSRHG